MEYSTKSYFWEIQHLDRKGNKNYPSGCPLLRYLRHQGLTPMVQYTREELRILFIKSNPQPGMARTDCKKNGGDKKKIYLILLSIGRRVFFKVFVNLFNLEGSILILKSKRVQILMVNHLV